MSLHALHTESGHFKMSGPKVLHVRVGKTGSASAYSEFHTNHVQCNELHVFPLDMDMLKYHDHIIISIRDPVQRYISILNDMLPGGEHSSGVANKGLTSCAPTAAVAADTILDDTPCGVLLRHGPSHLSLNYCYYMGGRDLLTAIEKHKSVYLIRQEYHDVDMAFVYLKIWKKLPPYKTVAPVHSKTHLSKELTPEGAKKLTAWLEMTGEYDVYRRLLSAGLHSNSSVN
jgi:hypothetical protein